jgi:hypothetical protein
MNGSRAMELHEPETTFWSGEGKVRLDAADAGP